MWDTLTISTADEARNLAYSFHAKEYPKCLKKITMVAKNGREYTYCPGYDIIIQRLKSAGFQVGPIDRDHDVKVSWSAVPPKPPCPSQNCPQN